MKAKSLFITLLGITILGWVSCDKVTNPNLGNNSITTCVSPPPVGSNFVTKTNNIDSNFRKVLIEDYTGHTCGNCPPAAVVAEALNSQYKDTVIVLAVHAGGFADPKAAPYTANFETPAGSEWDGGLSGLYFAMSNSGNPCGMVNRRDFPGPAHVKPYSTWGTVVSQLAPFLKGQNIRLNVTSKYDTVQRKLNVDVRHTFIRNYGDTAIKLSLVLSEDSIIDYQKDYSQAIYDVYPYVFMNMMRGALNGTWGDVVTTTCSYNYYRGFSVNPVFNDKHLNLIVFVYNGITYEIIQVEKIKIR